MGRIGNNLICHSHVTSADSDIVESSKGVVIYGIANGSPSIQGLAGLISVMAAGLLCKYALDGTSATVVYININHVTDDGSQGQSSNSTVTSSQRLPDFDQSKTRSVFTVFQLESLLILFRGVYLVCMQMFTTPFYTASSGCRCHRQITILSYP